MKQKRELVEQANNEFDTALLCKLLDLARSNVYYGSIAKDDSWLGKRIERICLTHHRHGYRRVTDELHRQGVIVSHKRVQRLMQEMALQVRPRRKKLITTRSQAGRCQYPNLLKGLEVSYPNQVWCADITYVPPANGQTAYLALLVDVFTRMIRGWSLERDMSVKLIDQALDKALATGHQPLIHHSDQGGQYIAHSYCQRLEGIDCRISMTDRGKPWENPYIESAIGRIKDEYILDEEYLDFQQAYRHLRQILSVVYNHQRPHSSLGNLTPAAFEARYEVSFGLIL